jgi:hypothetical protein
MKPSIGILERIHDVNLGFGFFDVGEKKRRQGE